MRRSHRRKQILNRKTSELPHPHTRRSFRPDEPNNRTSITLNNIGRPNISMPVTPKSDRQNLLRNLREQLLPIWIIEIQRNRARKFSQSTSKELTNLLKRNSRIGIVIQKNRDIERQPGQSPLRNSALADFQNSAPAPAFLHLSEHSIQIDRFRSRPIRRHNSRAEIVMNRTEQTDRLLPVIEQMLQQMRHTGFPIRASDSNQRDRKSVV